MGGGEFDHHGTNKEYRDDEIPYAACGLIWKKFGMDVLKFKNPKLSKDEAEAIFYYIDKNFIEGVDALDNGIWIDRTEIPLMHISKIVEKFNPLWNSGKDEDAAFNEAVEVVGVILRNIIEHRFSILAARSLVIRAYKNRTVPEVLVLDTYCPYGEALRDVDDHEEVLYVVYPRKDGYVMQSIRDDEENDRKKLPKSWAGLRDEELANVTGVHDAVFCHTGRFIVVAESFEGIMELARLAIDEPEY